MNRHPQRLDVAFEIVWHAAWHVGSGRGSESVDRLLRTRLAQGRRVPIVPGAQLKGVLRHQCERIFALFGGTICSPHLTTRQPPAELLDAFCPLARSPLLVDRLFGSRYQGECLFVEDALPVAREDTKEGKNNPAAAGPVEVGRSIRSRIAQSRVTGTVREKVLFLTEVAEAASVRYASRLSARHPAGALTQDEEGFPYEYSVLLAGLLSIDALGGDKSVGLGRCEVVIPGGTIRWNGVADYPVERALELLKTGDWFELLPLLRERASTEEGA